MLFFNYPDDKEINEFIKKAIEKAAFKQNDEYTLTFFDVYHQLEEGQVAISKDSGVEIYKENGNFYDQNGNLVTMKKDIMNDLYYIRKSDTKTMKYRVTLDEALIQYILGYTIKIQYRGIEYVLDHQSDVYIPFNALLEGEWFVEY